MRKPLSDDLKTAILVEDNPQWITLIRELLPEWIRLDCVVTLREAINKNLANYDVMLLNLILPDSPDPLESFLTIFRKVKSDTIPIIVISAQNNNWIRDEILDYGVSCYIDKAKWNIESFRRSLSVALNEPYATRYCRQYTTMSNLLNNLPLSDIQQLSQLF